MKKASYIISTIIQVLLLVGCYIITYFTKRKMGMARHIAFKNQEISQSFNIDLVKVVSIGVLVLFTIIVLIIFIKDRSKISLFTKLSNIAMVVTTTVFTVFVITSSIEKLKTYYYVSVLLALVTLIQIVKALVSILSNKSKVRSKEDV